ncbi:MAG: acyl-CoA dehydrogenase family protein [Candidatus Binatia bacterium]
MDFGFSEEQEQLKAQVARFLNKEYPLVRVRELMDSPEPFDRGSWKAMAGLGWQALTVPEEHGGVGLQWEDLAVVAEEMGRTLFPSPFLDNAVAARLLEGLGDERQKSDYLPRIASGELVVVPAVLEESDLQGPGGIEAAAMEEGGSVRLAGTKMFVPWAQAADLILVAVREAGGVSVFAVPVGAAGLEMEELRLVDPTRRAARLVLNGVEVDAAARVGDPGNAWPALNAALDAGLVAISAEMVGAADAALTLAAEYAKTREQFGQPIGRFQGVKHKLADIYVAVESARSLVYYASWAVDHADDAAASVAMAKAWASEALDIAGEEGIQIHGAIGFTHECDAQLYYKRGRYCRNLNGSPDYYYERVLSAQGL